jgi:hypothetical protein
MRLYHGGTDIVSQPDVTYGRKGLDFGSGFYLTNLLHQAETWALRLADRRNAQPIISVYEFDIESAKTEFKYKRFDHYDREWLDFIASNRKGSDAWKAYAWIEGGIADDRVVDTVEAYMADLIGVEQALNKLSHYEPNNQICITNQALVDKYLQYIESIIPNNQ